MIQPRRTSRSALTLLEVVLALAILAGSFATIAQLVGLGMRAAGNSRDLTSAQLLAESTMSEMAAGILPTESMNRVPLDTHPGWLVSAIVDTTPYEGILSVTVMTERDGESYRGVRYQLSRWIRDPNLPLPTEEEEEEASDGSDSDSSSPSSSSNSSTSGSNTPAGNSPTPPGPGTGGPGGGARPPGGPGP